MKSKVFVTFFLFSSSLGAFPSLFFTKEEIHLIHSSHEKTPENVETLHLSAIIYVNKDHWSLWINHQLIRSEQSLSLKGFQIKKVTPHSVTFSWQSSSSSVPLSFTLRPNQRFLVNEGRVLP